MTIAIVAGGQTGVDQAAWRAAKACGLATGGWMPERFRTEDGPRPEFADTYGARELEGGSFDHAARRRLNLRESDAAVVFNKGLDLSPGTRGLLADRRVVDRPILLITVEPDWTLRPIGVGGIAGWIVGALRDVADPVLMIAGNRESSHPGIGVHLELHLRAVFNLLLAATARYDDA